LPDAGKIVRRRSLRALPPPGGRLLNIAAIGIARAADENTVAALPADERPAALGTIAPNRFRRVGLVVARRAGRILPVPPVFGDERRPALGAWLGQARALMAARFLDLRVERGVELLHQFGPAHLALCD